MPLVTCPDCEKQVSDAAPACPHCGRPMRATTIEQTGKGYKVVELLAGAGFIVGCLFAFFSDGAPQTGGVFLLVGALFIFICARVGAWWAHG